MSDQVITNPMEMDKDQLAAYVAEHHGGVKLNMHTGIAKLREQVVALDQKKVAEAPPKEPETEEQAGDGAPEQQDPVPPVQPQVQTPPAAGGRYVMNPATGGVFTAAGGMAKAHPEWPACDADGTVF